MHGCHFAKCLLQFCNWAVPQEVQCVCSCAMCIVYISFVLCSLCTQTATTTMTRTDIHEWIPFVYRLIYISGSMFTLIFRHVQKCARSLCLATHSCSSHIKQIDKSYVRINIYKEKSLANQSLNFKMTFWCLLVVDNCVTSHAALQTTTIDTPSAMNAANI